MSEFCCRICGAKGQKHHSLFQWNLPLAADVRDKREDCEKYPIEPVVCTECGHVQLKESLDVDMYGNYLYTPSYSKEFQEYVATFADYVDNMSDGKRIVEIGSSNGYLLKMMQDKGWDVLGFEPSSELADAAERNGVQTAQICFGGDESVQRIKNWGVPDVVISRHVMEHLDDLNSIVKTISDIITGGGILL